LSEYAPGERGGKGGGGRRKQVKMWADVSREKKGGKSEKNGEREVCII